MFRTVTRLFGGMAALLLIATCVQAQGTAAKMPERARGTVSAVAADKMQITVTGNAPKGQTGKTTVIQLAADTKIRVVSADGKTLQDGALKDVAVGMFVAATGAKSATADGPFAATGVEAGERTALMTLLRAERAAQRAKDAPKADAKPKAKP